MAVNYYNGNGIGKISLSDIYSHPSDLDFSRDLGNALKIFADDKTARALVIRCVGKVFSADYDFLHLDRVNFSTAELRSVLARIEASERPVVALMRGVVSGAGLELALACHYRIAHHATRVGFPEVNLGLMPACLGTQRLPRLVGVPAALHILTSGKLLLATEAVEIGLVDDLTDEDDTTAITAKITSGLVNLDEARNRAILWSESTEEALRKADNFAEHKRHYPALAAIVRAVTAAAKVSVADGEEIEAREFESLRNSRTSRGLRHLRSAELGRPATDGNESAVREVLSAGVVGAGTMGGGIAMCFANAGIPVTLIDTSPDALRRGVENIRRHYESSVDKGKLSAKEGADRLARIKPGTSILELSACDLVVEAVYESMEVKKQVCAHLGAICKSGAIIATNTSSLDVNDLALASGRPEDFVGMHFFSPANVMRLVEIIRGARTAADVLATTRRIARRIGKVAVVSGVCFGFIGNRMLEPYLREAEFLLMEGASPLQIDSAMEEFGMAMGPCRMVDMAGVDVAAKVLSARGDAGLIPDDPRYRLVVRSLSEIGRYGQKAGQGFYRYDGRKAVSDPGVTALCESLASRHRIARRELISNQEITDRLIYSLVNEGMRILEEGIASCSSDVDLVWNAGYGFPEHLGGPLHFAEEVGLPEVLDTIKSFGRMHGDAFEYWQPAGLLESMVDSGDRLAELPIHKAWQPA